MYDLVYEDGRSESKVPGQYVRALGEGGDSGGGGVGGEELEAVLGQVSSQKNTMEDSEQADADADWANGDVESTDGEGDESESESESDSDSSDDSDDSGSGDETDPETEQHDDYGTVLGGMDGAESGDSSTADTGGNLGLEFALNLAKESRGEGGTGLESALAVAKVAKEKEDEAPVVAKKEKTTKQDLLDKRKSIMLQSQMSTYNTAKRKGSGKRMSMAMRRGSMAAPTRAVDVTALPENKRIAYPDKDPMSLRMGEAMGIAGSGGAGGSGGGVEEGGHAGEPVMSSVVDDGGQEKGKEKKKRGMRRLSLMGGGGAASASAAAEMQTVEDDTTRDSVAEEEQEKGKDKKKRGKRRLSLVGMMGKPKQPEVEAGTSSGIDGSDADTQAPEDTAGGDEAQDEEGGANMKEVGRGGNDTVDTPDADEEELAAVVTNGIVNADEQTEIVEPKEEQQEEVDQKMVEPEEIEPDEVPKEVPKEMGPQEGDQKEGDQKEGDQKEGDQKEGDQKEDRSNEETAGSKEQVEQKVRPHWTASFAPSFIMPCASLCHAVPPCYHSHTTGRKERLSFAYQGQTAAKTQI
jgi:hypothetical protein